MSHDYTLPVSQLPCPFPSRLAASQVWQDLAKYEEMLRMSPMVDSYRRVALLTLDWIIDEGGQPVLMDFDASGAVASDELPLSSRYALDALRLLGVDGYDRTLYGERARTKINGFCARQEAAGKPCGVDGVAALHDLVDEAHHAGSFARLFPPAGARGCGHVCDFGMPLGEGESTRQQPGSVTDQLTWAFLREHHAILPPRARLPPQKTRV